MAVQVFRDEREATRSAVQAHAGFESPADLRIARFSENVDIAKVHAGAVYASSCLVLAGGMIRVDKPGPKILPGSITVEPTWFEGTFTNDEQTEWLTVYVRQARLAEIGAELSKGGVAPDLNRVEGAADPILSDLIRSCAASLLRAERATRLELDGWAQVIGAHLARHHGTGQVASEAPDAALSPEALRIVLELIEGELDGDLSLATIAGVLDMGTTKLSAGFRAATGRSLHQYVIERRVEKARDLIETRKLSLAEIAFATGFCSQSHMTRAFRAHLGVTPGRYRADHRTH